MTHYPGHLVMGVAALAATLAIRGATINRLVKQKLRLSILLLGIYVAANLLLAVVDPATLNVREDDIHAFERLAFATAVVNLLVVSLINPLRADRVPDRFPRILQDFLIIGVVLIVATFLHEKLVATSAVGAVVLGFALQDTLGNAFAGLAIQSEKPFHVGHWVRLGDFEGRVAEVTWRATKLRTKTGNFVVLPNNVVAREPITNYSEPAAPTRLEVEVGAAYEATPHAVKAAMLEAMANSPRVLPAPAPDVVLASFDSSAITYRARFWIEDYERDEFARDQVRTAIYYSFKRRGIEIPWPIQVEYSREWPDADGNGARRERERLLSEIDLFASLSEEERREIASATATRVFGDGDAIVRQGEPGHSMFVVCSGAAAVVVEPDRREVAHIECGGYFGEMSILTGEPRSATVVARGEATVLEIDADLFRRLATVNPTAVEQIGLAAVTRRAELEQVKTSARSTEVAEAPASFLLRMKKFLSF